MKLKRWKMLSAAAACIAFAVGGAVLAGAEAADYEEEIAFADERENIELDYGDDGSDESNYGYVVDETLCQATITGYSGSETDIAIPSSVGGVKVTVIGENAFSRCSNLKSVTIPDGVTSIGKGAFAFCSDLTSVKIPSGVTSIEVSSFAYCSSLTSVTLPDTVTSIGTQAFQNCTSLESVTILGDVTFIGSYTFQGCAKLTDITIPGSVTTIGSNAFYDCSSLTSITIPGGVKSIELGTFYGCTKLESVTIQDGVTSIGQSAFSRCTSLTSVAIPDSVTSIGDRAFYNCPSLTSVTIPEGVTSIGNSTFWSCSSLTSVTIPKGVTSIGESAFSCCTSLTSVAIPEGVTSIGQYAFDGCSNLISVTFLNGVTSIGTGAFYDCVSLTSVTIPESVTSVGTAVFYGCTKLTSINADDNNANYKSVDGILYNKDMSKLIAFPSGKDGDYAIPNSVTSIDMNAFSGSASLKSVTIPDSVSSIKDWTFKDCTGLTSVTLPTSITSIEYMTFYNCTSLKSVSIPDGVTTIKGRVFSYCTSLTGVKIPDSVTSISGEAFLDTDNLSIYGYSGSGAESYANNHDIPFVDLNKIEIKLTAISDNSSIVLSWNEVEGTTGYIVKSADGKTQYTETAITDTTYTVTGLKNGTQYEFIVYACFGDIQVASDTVSGTPVGESVKVNATSGNRSITLSWNAAKNATGYIVKSADGKTQYTEKAITDTTYTVTGLSNGVKYKFKVYACFDDIQVPSSTVSKTPVAKPESVTATAASHQVTLSWEKVPNAVSYVVKSADGKIQYTKSAIKTTSYTATGLTNSTQYKFKVYAKSDGKWFASSTISKTPTGKPQNLKAVAGSKKITLSWDKVDGATGYIVKSADGTIQYTKNTIKTNSYTVTGLTGSKQYKFKVYAKVDGKWCASNTITRTAKK